MLAGLIDGKGVEVSWETIMNTYVPARWPIDQDLTSGTIGFWPRPFLAGLMRHSQDEPPGIKPRGSGWDMRVSSLLISPTRAILQAKNSYYVTPENLLHIVDGEAFHAWMALGAPDREAEQRYTYPLTFKSIGTVNLSGQVDRIDFQFGETVELKRTSAYVLKKTIEQGIEEYQPEWVWQARFYRLILLQNLRHASSVMRIFVSARDWKKPWPGKEPDARVGDFLVTAGEGESDLVEMRKRTLRLVKRYRDDRLPACKDRHRFGKAPSGLPSRCENFCDVKQFCPAYLRGDVA